MPETSRECIVILPDETQMTVPVQVRMICLLVTHFLTHIAVKVNIIHSVIDQSLFKI